MKKLLVLVLGALISICMFANIAWAKTCFIVDDEEYKYEGKDVTIELDGEKIDCDIPPIIYNDRTLLPIRALVEKIGGEVSWNEKKRVVEIEYEKKEIKLTIDSKKAKVNGKTVTLDVAACIAYEEGNGDAGRTVVPIRFVMENLGLKVDWDQDTYTVKVDSGKKEIENEKDKDGETDKELDEDNPYVDGKDSQEDPTTVVKPDENEQTGGKDSDDKFEKEEKIITLDEDNYIRIGLAYGSSGKTKTTITSASKIKIGTVKGDKFTLEYIVPTGKSVVATTSGSSSIAINVDGKTIATLSGKVRFIPDADCDDQVISVDGKKYRETIELAREAGKMRVINVLSMQHYLYGVVPSEMPASYGLEALKAQAVAARTYAYVQMGKHNGNDFDLCPGVHCQAYTGYANEFNITCQAVDETKDMVVKYDGKLISTFYSASMGPYTEDVENVWGTYYPYLRSVDNKYEPQRTPGVAYFTKAEIERILVNRGESVGEVLSVEIEEFTKAGRAYKLVIKGTKGTRTYYRETTRIFFGLKGQMYTISGGAGIAGLIELAKENADGDTETKTIAKVTTEALNVREKPDSEAEIIAQVYKKEKYEVLDEEEDYVKISTIYDDEKVTGWISKEYIDISEEKITSKIAKIAKITTEKLNVREENSTSADIISTVGLNEGYVVLKEKSGWAKIMLDEDTIGWVSKDYIDILEYDVESSNIAKELAKEGITFRIAITVYDNGHGVGMSQNGAKGMASAGFKYDEILKYYYTGVDVVKM